MLTRSRSGLLATIAAVASLHFFVGGCQTLRDSLSAEGGAPPSIESATRGTTGLAGLYELFLDAKEGRLLLLLPPPDDRGVHGECLYVEGLTTGLGSNPVGLDRGQLGPTRVVRLRSLGKRLVVEEANQAFRAQSDDPAERRAAEESFASSVLWSGEIVARDETGRVIVDFTSFVVRDAHEVVESLRATGQGDWSLDLARSALDPAACLAFPDNVEFEALLTFASSEPGPEVRATAPTASSISLVQHHSLVRLPDTGYRPRRHDPRSGSQAVSFHDYASPISAPLRVQWTVRHRLEKIDAGSPRSRARAPIVYYVDRGAPEPIRSALIEGASWWSEAFEAAGFADAFRVELLPEGAHPLDVRYNVIQWVHRATRGWSYGGGVVDPRTGEVIKGHVTLGSLRVRHDRLLFEGLVGAEETGSGASDDPVLLALARIRQLSAHEVGHTLGFEHNFAASTYLGRASVMDYPAPLVRLAGDELDLSQAYAVGIGAWDVQAVRYAYSEFAPGVDEAQALEAILRVAGAQGLHYLGDADARPPGAAHPLANLWDNGVDPIDELENARAVRRWALERFGSRNVVLGRPLAELQEVLAPVYFLHRYQLEAALKSIGGMSYVHSVHGMGESGADFVSASEQRRALEQVLACLAPGELDLPESVLALLLPRPPGEGRNREMFAAATDPAFDALGAAASAADLVVSGLLQRERMARLVDFHRRDESLPSLEEILDQVIGRVFRDGTGESARHAEIRRAVQDVAIARLLAAAADASTPEPVRWRLTGRLEVLASLLRSRTGEVDPDGPHALHLTREIERFFARPWPSSAAPPAASEAPPGMPIGLPESHGLADEECPWTALQR